MRNKNYLRKSKYFKELDDQDYNALQRCLMTRVLNFKKGEEIIHQGDKIDSALIILEGHARSFHIDSDGNQNISLDYFKDDTFGLEFILKNSKTYSESLISLTDSIVLFIDSFKAVNLCQNRCKRHTTFIKLLFENMANQYLNMKSRAFIITKSKTRDKILSYLYLKQKELKKSIFTIPYNRNELALFLGVERSALSYELSKLKKEGIIDFNKNEFKIIKK